MSSANATSLTGTRLRKRREAVGLSVAGLAYKAGVSYKTIERLEAGDTQPRRATEAVLNMALAEAEQRSPETAA